MSQYAGKIVVARKRSSSRDVDIELFAELILSSLPPYLN